MNCVVTAGPTYEELDQVRRLTNFSTGRLGSLLANFLTERRHTVTLLLGHYATFRGEQKAQRIVEFTTTSDLRGKLELRRRETIDAVFHAAAVSDFLFGRIYSRDANGGLEEVRSGKISSRSGSLLAELIPAPKIIAELRAFFPASMLVGWKYEVDGDRESVLDRARQQLVENETNACVANGPAYGAGFGLVTATEKLPAHLAGEESLFESLEKLALQRNCH